ncbi:MAG: NTP transferase domain-containing protein, partial [Chloroflexi bacterium]|nr:NTP transferase domain-containing protein [Chloroflexota bacterium]
MRLAVVVLAAGQGLRMKSQLPKVLFPVAGQPMIAHVLDTARQVGADQQVIVLGHQADAVRAALGQAEDVSFVVQQPQLGTGHAVRQARPILQGQSDTVLVVYGDMPLLTAGTLRRLVECHHEGGAAVTLLTVTSDDPQGFGRIVRDDAGHVQAIVEESAATQAQLGITELNCGICCFRASWLWDRLSNLPLSPKGEYYLTDMVELAVADGVGADACPITNRQEVLGINTRVHLAQAETVARRRICERHMLNGVTILDPGATIIDVGVQIGAE